MEHGPVCHGAWTRLSWSMDPSVMVYQYPSVMVYQYPSVMVFYGVRYTGTAMPTGAVRALAHMTLMTVLTSGPCTSGTV